jgi:hypothetical protein
VRPAAFGRARRRGRVNCLPSTADTGAYQPAASGRAAREFRSTFRDWCGDHTEFPREVAEAALVHVIGDKAEAAYRRSDALDKPRKLMDAWARFCDSASEPADADIVPMQ